MQWKCSRPAGQHETLLQTYLSTVLLGKHVREGKLGVAPDPVVSGEGVPKPGDQAAQVVPGGQPQALLSAVGCALHRAAHLSCREPGTPLD